MSPRQLSLRISALALSRFGPGRPHLGFPPLPPSGLLGVKAVSFRFLVVSRICPALALVAFLSSLRPRRLDLRASPRLRPGGVGSPPLPPPSLPREMLRPRRPMCLLVATVASTNAS